MKIKKKKIMAFLIMPLFFLILSYSILYLLLKPIATPYISLISLFTNPVTEQNTDTSNIDYSNYKFPKSINFSDIKIPSQGTQFGNIIIDEIDLNLPLYYGDDKKTLDHGVGMYVGSTLPGLSKPTLIAGHAFPFFKPLVTSIKEGMKIKITTFYGAFYYEVTSTNIAHMNDESAFNLNQNVNELILYTCYPVDSLGSKDQRFYVHAKLTEGTKIIGDPYAK